MSSGDIGSARSLEFQAKSRMCWLVWSRRSALTTDRCCLQQVK